MTEGSRTIEVERKYDVDADMPLPDWIEVGDIETVSDGELRVLDARYFDTADATLARAGVAVRRRTGGTDAGWHIKGPRQGDGRLEIAWPLGADEEIPDAVTEALAPWTAAPLHPLARIQNNRTAYLLHSSSGVIAEFVDDRVRAIDLRRDTQTQWREWEIELGPAAPAGQVEREAFFAAVEKAVFTAGAKPAASDSKLARALGH